MDAALLDVRSMMYLFLADALDREPVLVRALAEHDVVILDRHTLISGWAYQLEHHDIDTLIPAQQRFRFRMPDLTVILDVEPELSRERVFKKRGQAINAIYEKDDREYTQRLRDRYLAYHLLHDNTIMLDGERRTEELAYQVAHQITKMRNEGGEK
jgi:thymidylate kinase